MKNYSNKSLFIFGLIVSWCTCYFFIIPISTITVLVVSFFLYNRKSSLLKYFIALNPLILLPTINIGSGIKDYINNEARIKFVGFPDPESANIDEQYRIPQTPLGCNFTGIEYLTSFRYNQSVKILINTFGYQQNSYTGIYPTKEEALEVIDKNGEQGILTTASDKIQLEYNSQKIEIRFGETHPLVAMTFKELKPTYIPQYKIMEDNCLIAKLSSDWLYLIELENEKVIAQYKI